MQKHVRTTGRSNSSTRSGHRSFVTGCASNAMPRVMPDSLAVLEEVLDVDGPERVGQLALAGVHGVLDLAEVCMHDVGLRLAHVARGVLGGGNLLEQPPE